MVRLNRTQVNASSRKAKASSRVSGQALVEGAAATILLCAVGVPILILLLNIGTFMTWTVKLNYIAGESARYIDANKYWLGMERPNYNREKTIQNAVSIANAMLKCSGLPQLGERDFDVMDVPVEIYPPGANTAVKINVTQVVLRPPGLTLGLSKFLPSPLTIQGVGISTDASNAIAPPMVVTACGKMQTLNGLPGPQEKCNLSFPCYGAGTCSGGAIDSSGYFTPKDHVGIPGAPKVGNLTPGFSFIGMGVDNVTPVVDLGKGAWTY
jgi:hypothetical protein